MDVMGLKVTYGKYEWTIIQYSAKTDKVQLSRPQNGYVHKWVSVDEIGGLRYIVDHGSSVSYRTGRPM